MHVARLKISGFRGVRSADIVLGRHAVLVGPNNSGKTTVIEALALLFGRDRLVRRLTEHDFHCSEPDETARILCIATVTGFTPNDPHHHSSWFSPERGVEKWFDPKAKTLSAAPDAQHTDLAVQIGFAARFDLDELEADPCIHCGIAQDKVPVGACQGDFTKAKPVAFRSLGVRHDGVEHFLIRYSDWSVREHHAHVSYHSPYYHFGHSREMDNTLRYDPRLNT